jgi:hypothetical protein
MFFGQREYHQDGSYITTEWIAVCYVPLIPLRSFRLRYHGPGISTSSVGFGSVARYAVYQKALPNWRQVLCTYGLIGLYVAALFLMVKIGEHYFPSGFGGHPIAFFSGLAAVGVVPAFIPAILRRQARRKASSHSETPA